MTGHINAMDQCPECGVWIRGGLGGCQEVLSGLAFRFPASGPEMRLHRLIVDAFCLQHPETYCRSPKSMAAHLAGLCCGMDFAGHPHVYRALQQWLNGAKSLYRPDPPPQAAGTTIHDVARATPSMHFTGLVERWAESVWSLWSAHHDLARNWLKEVLGDPLSPA